MWMLLFLPGLGRGGVTAWLSLSSRASRYVGVDVGVAGGGGVAVRLHGLLSHHQLYAALDCGAVTIRR